MTHRRTGISLRGLPSLPPVSCWPVHSLMQAAGAFVHALTTLWDSLMPAWGRGGSGAAAERGVVDVARERAAACAQRAVGIRRQRSEEHTSELQSLMRISYAVFCLKKKTLKTRKTNNESNQHTAT